MLCFTQVGQCGNQLGSFLFSCLDDNSSPSLPQTSKKRNTEKPTETTGTFNGLKAPYASRMFFRRSPQQSKNVARAILIDTEPKVRMPVNPRRNAVFDGIDGRKKSPPVLYLIIMGYLASLASFARFFFK